MKILSLILTLSLFTQVTHAHNNLFFPGDSFFSVKVNADYSFTEKTEVVFDYKRLSNMFMACGYAGCNKLKVDLSKDLSTKLDEAHKILFTQYSQDSSKAKQYNEEGDVVKEVNTFTFFVYNKDFDYKNNLIGLRYNENWVKVQTEDAKRDHAIYDGPENRSLVVADWANSKEVKPLAINNVPKSIEGFMGVDEPIGGKGSDYIFIVPITKNVWNSYMDEKGFKFLVIGESVKVYTYKQGKVTEANKLK